MILYNVTVSVDKSAESEWLDWMKNEHIPEVLATNLFNEHKLLKILQQQEGDSQTYAIRYFLSSMADFETYESSYAATLRSKSQKAFGDKCVAFRTLLQVVD